MHKLSILFNISNTNCIKVSNITLGKYTLHICNIINLTVCEKKKLLESKIRLKFHFNKSHGNVRLSTLVGFISQCFLIFLTEFGLSSTDLGLDSTFILSS